MTGKIKYTKQIQAFDPKAQFLVRRTFKSNGTTYFGGELFKKDAVDVRRLRQLFEGGYILVAEEGVLVEQGQPDNEPVQEVPQTVESAAVEEPAVSEEVVPEAVEEVDDGLAFTPKKRGPKPKAK